ncbi:MAG: 1-acyl-sn-glycerol-3-phosphate acyltransferase [Polyangiaceae bacterium]|nr:1-acyl-sn-glycerol-3-phosphate acyltransferase [Polyangiaceae bacterium]
MRRRSPTGPYQPSLALRALSERFFGRIAIDQEWLSSVRRLADQGTVVYVLRNLNVVDFLALDFLTKRHGLPEIRFVNDLGMGALEPMGRGLLGALLPRSGDAQASELREAVERGHSAALFLKRPPGVLDLAAGASGGRGLTEGDALMRTLIDVQRERARPILLVPQVFVWSRLPDTRGTRTLDLLLGPREWPSALRTAGQVLANASHAELRAGEPLSLAAYLAESDAPSDAVRIRRITYALLRRVERERVAITGPAQKPPDRVRDEILRSPRLARVVEELAGERAEDRGAVLAEAERMLRGLQATLDVDTVRALELLFDKVFHTIYAGIEFDREGLERIRAAAKDGTVVLLPSHKSHIDYLLLSYVFYEEKLQLPLIAAGDNLSFFPLGPLFRRGGAFFIRRSFKGDRLYSAVVDAYVRRLIREGHPLELFLEGGRSRTGKLLPPKLGLLSMIVTAALAVTHRRTYFVPISIGYERLVEGSAYERELRGGEKEKEDAAGLLRTTAVLRDRYGRINLQVGEILTLDQLREELDLPLGAELEEDAQRALVTRLGNRVMDEMNRVTAMTPGALVALVLLTHTRRGLPHDEVVDRARKLLGLARRLGARATPSLATGEGALREEALGEALEMLMAAELVEAHRPADGEVAVSRRPTAGPDAIYVVPDAKRLALDTTKNIVVHFFVERALVAIALLRDGGPPIARAVLRERVQVLSRLFKYEFRFRADASFDEIFDRTLEEMAADGKLALLAEQRVGAGVGADGWSGAEWLEIYAATCRNFLEGYRVAARGLGALVKGPLTEKDLARRTLALGGRMFLAGELELRECVSKPILQNAFLSFVDQGYLAKRDGKLELQASFASARAVAAIEGRVAGYLGRR